MDLQQIAALVAALGGGAAVSAVISGVRDMISGKAQDELQRNRDAIQLRNDAWSRADEAEADAQHAHNTKRRALELASRYRRQVIELGGTPAEWPGDLK